jgi:hypothetical protein
MENADGTRFLELRSESLSALLDHDGDEYTSAVEVRVQVRGGDL